MRRLEPVHILLCIDCDTLFNEGLKCKCPAELDAAKVDMGWRVGEASANYSWYSSRERALTDKRCK